MQRLALVMLQPALAPVQVCTPPPAAHRLPPAALTVPPTQMPPQQQPQQRRSSAFSAQSLQHQLAQVLAGVQTLLIAFFPSFRRIFIQSKMLQAVWSKVKALFGAVSIEPAAADGETQEAAAAAAAAARQQAARQQTAAPHSGASLKSE